MPFQKIVRIIGGLPAALCLLVASDPPHTPDAAGISPGVMLISESVLQTQWPHTLELVNAPGLIAQANPGQCVRIGVVANGKDRDEYLRKVQLQFTVHFAGQTDRRPLAPLSQYKQIKPEGGDFVTAALAAGGVKAPEIVRTMASMGASSSQWCVPADAHDGAALIQVEVETPHGRQKLVATTLRVQSWETGNHQVFKDAEDLGRFIITYYRQPNPARLLPALRFSISQQTAQPHEGQFEILTAFLSAAWKADRAAASFALEQVPALPPIDRAVALLALRSAGYDIGPALTRQSAADQEKFRSLPNLPDPFDQTPDQGLFSRLDMRWAIFGATGQMEAVRAVAGALAWRTDYDEFDKIRRSGKGAGGLTPSIARGVTYMAAGWSLNSLQRQDPLVADYIEWLRASPGTPETVRSELSGLKTNKAFQRNGN